MGHAGQQAAKVIKRSVGCKTGFVFEQTHLMIDNLQHPTGWNDIHFSIDGYFHFALKHPDQILGNLADGARDCRRKTRRLDVASAGTVGNLKQAYVPSLSDKVREPASNEKIEFCPTRTMLVSANFSSAREAASVATNSLAVTVAPVSAACREFPPALVLPTKTLFLIAKFYPSRRGFRRRQWSGRKGRS